MQGSSTNANGSAQTLNTNSKSRLIYLIPKYPFSVIHNVPANFSMAFSYLPILLYRLDISLLHFQLLQTLNIPVKLKTLTGCLSAPVANLPVNYEALEFVGDAILYYFLSLVLFQKHPTQHEGFLSRERTRLLDNAFLYNLALEHDIHQYIISTRFSMKSFRTWLLKGDQLQSLPDKMLADVMEAMMAGCYVDGGIRAAFQYFQLFWKNHASRFGYDALVAENAKLYRNKQSSSLVKSNIDISGLEDIIEYRFKNREIGYEAITVSATPNYQRLEWLGDAVLQILITEYIYLNFPNLAAGEMSILRQVGANNSFLGMIVVRLGIHRYLYPLNDPLVFAFEKRLEILFNELDEDQAMIDGIWEKLDAPKILGDVFESILGAIFIDSGGSLEIARDWFQRVFNPYMSKYINPENVQLHPVKVLRELVQGQRCSGLNITYESFLVSAFSVRFKLTYRILWHNEFQVTDRFVYPVPDPSKEYITPKFIFMGE
ncbi:ribonuclease III domain-containing protein [Paraphysoderma sedebokerense]|nr:ribonuclease III domain-containing protein [Paraphysoderma sedebokerense]